MTRVLLTGGAGFIGRHLSRYILANTDWKITVLDRLGEGSRLAEMFTEAAYLEGTHRDRIVFHWHDLRAPLKLEGAFDYVAHLAAGSHVDRSVKDPLGFVADNVVGTANLLEWIRATQPTIKKVLYFSTDEVFGPANGEAFDEYSAHTPNNPYAASKAAAEALIPAWANTYGLPLVVTHCTNVYGPGQDGEKFIPLVTSKVKNGELVQVHSKAGVPSSRYYVHVDDVSRAVLTILQKGGVWGGPWTGKYNITGDTEFSNLDVAERIAGLIGKPLNYELVDFVPNRPRHDMRYAIKGERLRELGWAPTVDFDAGLRQVVT